MNSTFTSGCCPKGPGQFRDQDRIDHEFSGGDADSSRGLFTKLGDRREAGFDLFKPRSQIVEQALPRLRRRHAAGGARQQTHAEARFELADDVTERRLRHAELRGRLREAAFLADRHERKEVIEIAALHLSLRDISSFGL